MKFLWYGPFRYEEQNSLEMIELFKLIGEAKEHLGQALGVYVIAAMDQDGRPLPWYVGKASKHDMGARVMGHLNKDKFRELIEDGKGISLYLFAAVDEAKELLSKGHLSEAEHDLISDLERGFIGCAFERNSSLSNVRLKGSAKYEPIPGYITPGSPSGDNRELALLLGFEQK